MKRIHLFVSGRVQGVFFRSSAARLARSLGVTGWVRNLPDGRVEIVAEGESEYLHRFVKWCHAGPSGAHVEGVHVQDEPLQKSFTAFDIH